MRDPELAIFLETPLSLPVYTLPKGALVFQRERHSRAPLLAGIRHNDGGVLWAATDPGPQGYEHYPYLIHALRDLGLTPPFRGARTWAFFDYSYRTRVDLDYMASRWRQAGIAALHVSAWHFHDPDPTRDDYLQRLIEACHREGVLVYAWLELPHVSEAFWRDEPNCREQTAALQDAQLDWRKLVNLADADCFERVAKGVSALLDRFDWDGVNLAELYFESLHGPSNPQRFTPMNEWVRREYETRAGFDPAAAFRSRLAALLELERGSLAELRRLSGGIGFATAAAFPGVARSKATSAAPDGDADRRPLRPQDAGTAGGRYGGSAGVGRAEYDFQLVVEDPATQWDLGPRRYHEIARRYREIAPRPRTPRDRHQYRRSDTKRRTRRKSRSVPSFCNSRTSPARRLHACCSISNTRSGARIGTCCPMPRRHVPKSHVMGDRWVVEASREVGVTFAGPVTVNGDSLAVYRWRDGANSRRASRVAARRDGAGIARAARQPRLARRAPRAKRP